MAKRRRLIDIVKFFIENASQIAAFVQSIIDSMAAVAAGDVGFVAQSVEEAMARTVPLIIGFMASLLGIDGLAEKVQTIIMGVRTRIDQAIDGMIDKAKDWFKGNGKKGRNPEEEEAEGEQQNDPATQLPDNRTPEQKRADFDKGMNEGMTALAAPNKTTAELQQSLQAIKLKYRMDELNGLLLKEEAEQHTWTLKGKLGDNAVTQQVLREPSKAENEEHWWEIEIFETFEDGEQHRFFFEGEGKDAKLFMQSKKVSIPKRIEALAEGDVKTNLLTQYENSVEIPVKERGGKVMENEEEEQKFQKQIANALHEIATALKTAEGEEELPPTSVTYQQGGGRPHKIIANPLTNTAGNTSGKESNNRTIIAGNDLIDKWIMKTGEKHPQSTALGIHLLAHHLHGPWESWNVVFGAKKLNEGQGMKLPEKIAQEQVEDNQILSYEMKVNYFEDTQQDALITENDDPLVDDLRKALGYYIAESIEGKVYDKDNNKLFDDTLDGVFPQISTEPAIPIEDTILKKLKESVTGEEIIIEGTPYLVTTYNNLELLAKAIGRKKEVVTTAFKKLQGEKKVFKNPDDRLSAYLLQK